MYRLLTNAQLLLCSMQNSDNEIVFQLHYLTSVAMKLLCRDNKKHESTIHKSALPISLSGSSR